MLALISHISAKLLPVLNSYFEIMIAQQIGLGTAAIGRPEYINIKSEQNTSSFDLAVFRDNGIKVLNSAYQLGVRYFDTAPGYGMAEQLLKDWLKTQGDTSIEVATKWGYSYVADFQLNATQHEIKDHSLKQLNKQWQISKQLLPYLTTLQIHSATFDTGVLQDEQVLNKLAEIKAEHNLHIGLTTSGDNQVEVIRAAMKIMRDDVPVFDVFQITYNMLEQSLLTIVDELKNDGNRIVVKEALANGRIFRNASYPQYEGMYMALEQMAHKYNVGVDAIALRFCIDSIQPFMVLSGAATSKQVEENLKVQHFSLEQDELATLKSYAIDSTSYWNERKQLAWQ